MARGLRNKQAKKLRAVKRRTWGVAHEADVFVATRAAMEERLGPLPDSAGA
jgi:hypothetical protein